jgi:glycosyltransferase involved in cell wall biosynthesis
MQQGPAPGVLPPTVSVAHNLAGTHGHQALGPSALPIQSPVHHQAGAGRLGVVRVPTFGFTPSQGNVSPHLQGVWQGRKDLWKKVGGIVVSSVLSIHNRSKLFKRALYGYLWQTMPPESWEIILVDDCSTEDLSETYKPLLGRINLRHVKFDHTRHPIFKKKNPGWTPRQPKNWFHTPALTINLGVHLARGPIISLCHPEVLHAPENFELASVRILGEECYLFATTYLGTQESNLWLDRNPSWVNFGWQGFLSRVAAPTLDRYGAEKYWYTSFLPRIAARKIGGVDFAYMDGVAGEDDDFRDRIDRAGFPAIYAPELEGFHQDHSNETESHRIRTTDVWRKGLAHNRALYNQRRKSGSFPIPANTNWDWTAKDCFVEEFRFRVGSREPEIIRTVS